MDFMKRVCVFRATLEVRWSAAENSWASCPLATAVLNRGILGCTLRSLTTSVGSASTCSGVSYGDYAGLLLH